MIASTPKLSPVYIQKGDEGIEAKEAE